VEAILALIVGGLVVGALARLALPGPDPLPIWATILLGIAGSVLGGGIGFAAAGPVGAILSSVVAASLLLLAYRRFVQKRPITGPAARRPPGREHAAADEDVPSIERLEQLRDAGVISAEEFELRRRGVADRP
jgi:uncharacterized membrane protein YeaQ/YmgE (transglycosylase-associated protein family)